MPSIEAKKTSIWFHAGHASRTYVTPEDITAAIEAGAPRAELQQEVLEAVGAKACEDWSLCAFVAAEKWRARR